MTSDTRYQSTTHFSVATTDHNFIQTASSLFPDLFLQSSFFFFSLFWQHLHSSRCLCLGWVASAVVHDTRPADILPIRWLHESWRCMHCLLGRHVAKAKWKLHGWMDGHLGRTNGRCTLLLFAFVLFVHFFYSACNLHFFYFAWSQEKRTVVSWIVRLELLCNKLLRIFVGQMLIE